MKITNIEETGCNDILRWAIANEVNLFDEPELIGLINNETSYTITFSDITFFELYRLTQLFRNRLKIIEEKEFIKEFNKDYLASLFRGKFHMDEDGNLDLAGDIPTSDLANRALQSFVNLALQLSGNSDIIQTGTVRLMLPMINRRFDVNIPIDFGAFLGCFDNNVDDLHRIFNRKYPSTLSQEVSREDSNILRLLAYKFVQSTALVRYTTKSEQLLKLIKYVPLGLSSAPTNKLYKIGTLGFRKYDSISRADYGCSLFNRLPNELWTQRTRRINLIDSKLKVDFAVQLPMQYLQIIENTLSNEILPIKYESDIQNIIENGLVFNNFKSDYPEDISEEEQQQFADIIESYSTRINEANQFALNVISLLLKDNENNDENSIISILPSIYATNAVFTINMEYKDIYLSKFNDVIINGLFKEMISLASSLSYDMSKTK